MTYPLKYDCVLTRGAHAGGEVPGGVRAGHGGDGAAGDHQVAAGEGAAAPLGECENGWTSLEETIADCCVWLCAAQFRDLVKSRNTDIQEEYARMLKELDDQTESLDQDVAKERELKAERAKRRQEEALEREASKKQKLEEEKAQLKGQLEEVTAEIRQLQEVFATLEKEDENENSPDDAQSAEEQRRREEERAQNEIVELQQEIVLLKEAQEAIAEKIDVRVRADRALSHKWRLMLCCRCTNFSFRNNR
ncbi:unnamed protein product [Phytophthora lilii]|uniref:Unnamed protein product n=1 Tax=Phytophthora lilii TaxID=2077276 RepID=A0A9W6WR87_9STRA|nr:unnamed protein product [Phytophthora lilii]